MNLLMSAATVSFTIRSDFPFGRGYVQTQHHHQPKRNHDAVKRAALALQDAESDMQHEQRISDIHHHMQRFPNRCAQVREPEVVAGSGHQEQNDEREESKRLKWHTGDRTAEWTAFEDAQDGIGVTACVISNDDQSRVDQAKSEHRYPGVTAIVEHWQEFRIQPA